MDTSEYLESSTIKFEWTLHGLSQLFESSKGEVKSKVTKSTKFGGGRWQILFYANSGTVNQDGHGFVSLYLACEPTNEEKEKAIDEKWVREGVYNFGFEIRNVQKTITFNSKEATNHSFSWETINWGWSQFARREAVYHQPNTVRQQDAFLIICTITSSPSSPTPAPTIPRSMIPRDLLDAMGSLLDDPIYSDIEFVVSRRRGVGNPRIIYAARKLLKRVDYFATMFRSGFSEDSDLPSIDTSIDTDATQVDASPAGIDSDAETEASISTAPSTHITRFEDSDDEEDEEDDSYEEPTRNGSGGFEERLKAKDREGLDLRFPKGKTQRHNMSESWDSMISGDQQTDAGRGTDAGEDFTMGGNEHIEEDGRRNVRPKLSHPSTPRDDPINLEEGQARGEVNTPTGGEPDYTTRGDSQAMCKDMKAKGQVPSSKKVRIVIQDTSYATYKAVLYYIYTDIILFAPLASSFYSSSPPPLAPAPTPTPIPSFLSSRFYSRGAGGVGSSTPALTESGNQSQNSFFGNNGGSSLNKPPPGGTQEKGAASTNTARVSSRREWIRNWEKTEREKSDMHGASCPRPRPCSAKAVYRLADKLDLQELKERAFQHIINSLTVDNVAYEVFSDFSAAFEEVRKVEVAFFLQHWASIRTSDAMRNVWQQIRVGRHPGFEEVWPLIAENLEFKSKSTDA